jgi:hypothetical protein
MSKSTALATLVAKRRTKDEIMHLRWELQRIVEKHRPLTVRAVFYLAVAAMLIAKSEREYKHTIVRLLSVMREEWLAHERDGKPPTGAIIPFGSRYIVDASRWIRKPTSYSGPEAALQRTAAVYRRDLWEHAAAYVAFYCEKETIADLVYQQTAKWDVPLSVFHSFSSKGFLYENAEAIAAADKPAYLYFLRDHDPSGDRIFKSAVSSLIRYAPRSADIHIEQLAVTPEQIRALSLPTRPTKTEGNTHAKGWTGGRSVEVDAIPPAELRRIINSAIERHVNQRALKIIRVAEQSERELMARISGRLPEIEEWLNDQGPHDD